MRTLRVRFSVRTMLAGVAIAGIASAIKARIHGDNVDRLNYLVFNATIRAKTEFGDLSKLDVTYQWSGDYSAQVNFRPKCGVIEQGKIYRVDSCCCGMRMDVTSTPLP